MRTLDSFKRSLDAGTMGTKPLEEHSHTITIPGLLRRALGQRLPASEPLRVVNRGCVSHSECVEIPAQLSGRQAEVEGDRLG